MRGPGIDRQVVFEFLDDVERTLPVAEWAIGSLHAWPVQRVYYAFELFTLGEFNPNSQIARYSGGRGHRLRQIAKAMVDAVIVPWRDRGRNAHVTTADVLFLVNSTTRFFKVGGEWYNPYCDSFEGFLELAGLRGLVLEATPDGGYRLPRFRPSRLIQGHLFARSLQAKLTSRLRSGERLPGWEDFAARAAASFGETWRPRRAVLRWRLEQVRLFARYFGRLLDRVRPAAVLLSGYYSTDAMGLIAACRERGITAVEVQHGVMSDQHPAYRPWHALPSDGYETLPDVFWCWNAADAAMVTAWTSGVTSRHRAFHGGNPCLHVFDRNGTDLAGWIGAAIAARFTAGSRPGRQVLFTAQAFYELPPVLLSAIERTPGWTWWIRVHPQYWETRGPLREALAARGMRNVDIDLASDLPLASVLRHMDAHVTEFSSSVLEAEALGIPSVVLAERAVKLYRPQIASGVAVYAGEGEDLVAAVDAQIARRQAGAFPAAAGEAATFEQGCHRLEAIVREARDRHSVR